MAKFVALLTYGDQAARLAARPRHRDYLRQLYDQGKVIIAGPFGDDRGALIIYEAADAAEVRDLFANDPYSQAAGAIASFEIRAWTQVVPAPAEA